MAHRAFQEDVVAAWEILVLAVVSRILSVIGRSDIVSYRSEGMGSEDNIHDISHISNEPFDSRAYTSQESSAWSDRESSAEAESSMIASNVIAGLLKDRVPSFLSSVDSDSMEALPGTGRHESNHHGGLDSSAFTEQSNSSLDPFHRLLDYDSTGASPNVMRARIEQIYRVTSSDSLLDAVDLDASLVEGSEVKGKLVLETNGSVSVSGVTSLSDDKNFVVDESRDVKSRENDADLQNESVCLVRNENDLDNCSTNGVHSNDGGSDVRSSCFAVEEQSEAATNREKGCDDRSTDLMRFKPESDLKDPTWSQSVSDDLVDVVAVRTTFKMLGSGNDTSVSVDLPEKLDSD